MLRIERKFQNILICLSFLFFASINCKECNTTFICECPSPIGPTINFTSQCGSSNQQQQGLAANPAAIIAQLNFTESPVNANVTTILNCTKHEIVNSEDAPRGTNETFVLQLNYPCEPPPSPTTPPTSPTPTIAPTTTIAPPNPPPDEHSSYSTGTILIIIFFTFVFAYLCLGVAVNFFLIGSRGIEVIPNLNFWRDVPGLVRDGITFVGNGFTVRPSDLHPTGDGYDAI